MLASLALLVLLLASGAWVVRLTHGRITFESIGLVGGAGLAVQVAAQAWLGLLGAPPLARAAALVLLALPGCLTLPYRRPRAAWHPEWTADAGLLALACLLPLALFQASLGGVVLPLWNYDGAFHTEIVEALRHGSEASTWYPTGLHLLLSAFLTLTPGLDSALGSLQLTWAFASLAVLAVFGVAFNVWGSTRVAALAALLVASTALFPYFPHTFSNWPFVAGMVLALTAWSLGSAYMRQPSTGRVLLAGLIGGAVVLLHGIELYTIAVWLAVELAGHARRLDWLAVGRHAVLAAVLAILVATPYLPTLVGWAAHGGAVASGAQEISTLIESRESGAFDPAFWVSGQGVSNSVLDLPLRVALFGLGVASLVRARRGRRVLVVLLVFGVLGSVAKPVDGWSAWLYAHTYPWMDRMRMLVGGSVLLNLVEAAGLAWLLGCRWWSPSCSRLPPFLTSRRWSRLAGVLLLAASGLAAVTSVGVSMVGWAEKSAASTPADAAAFTWLRAHARPGEVVLNDYAADAGIWLPFKAGVPVALPRSELGGGGADAETVLDGLASLRLEGAAACRVHIRYVYQGARVFALAVRTLPPPEALAAIPGVTRMFEQDGAAVYHIDHDCP